MQLLRRLGLSLILALWASGASAACLSALPLTFKDAAGATQTLCFGGAAGQYLGQTNITDNSGNIVGTTSNALDINIKSGSIGNTAFIANAGTNLNTSLLALDSTLALLELTQGGAIGGAKGPLVFGSVTTAKPAYTTAQTSPLSLDTAGLLRISWADTPVNATKLLVTPDSVALPLHQSVNVDEVAGSVLGAIANYGTSPGAVLVPGVNAFVTNTPAVTCAACALDTSVNGLLLAQGSTTSGQKGPLTLAAVTTGKPTYTTAQSNPLSMDVNGLLRISWADTPVNGTKLLVTPDALPANQSINVAQVLGNATATAASGTMKVGIVGNAGATLDAVIGAATAPTNQQVVGGVFNTTAPAPTTGQSAALQLSGLSNLLVEQGCAGQSVANTSVKVISLASTTSLKIVTLASNKKVYICQLNLVSATAQNVALIEGTISGTDCNASTAGLAGGTTAATGWNLAANGGLTVGNGQGIVFKSGSVSLDVCLLSSSTGQISGTITYAQF